MSFDTQALEPFPLFVDSAEATRANFFSKMGSLAVFSPSGASKLRFQQASATNKFTNYLTLRYYQYSVTFGLYVMDPIERMICNAVVLGIFGAISYAMYYGLQPFFVRSICHLLYYMTGGLQGVEDLCTGPTCS